MRATVDPTSSHNLEEPLLHEQLVAYLDNELDKETSLNIEQMMADNPTVREQIQQLQRAWDLLDELPRAEADERFTTSTVELIASDVEAELSRQQLNGPRLRRRWWLISGVTLMAAGFCGVWAAELLWPRPDENLLRNFPVIRQLDAYRQAGNVPFLRSLQSQDHFLPAEQRDGP